MPPKAARAPLPGPADGRMAEAHRRADAVALGVKIQPFLGAWEGFRTAPVAAGRSGEAIKRATAVIGRRDLLRFLAAVESGAAPPLSFPKGVCARGPGMFQVVSSLLLDDRLPRAAAAWANAQLQRGLAASSVGRSLDSLQRCVAPSAPCLTPAWRPAAPGCARACGAGCVAPSAPCLTPAWRPAAW